MEIINDLEVWLLCGLDFYVNILIWKFVKKQGKYILQIGGSKLVPPVTENLVENEVVGVGTGEVEVAQLVETPKEALRHLVGNDHLHGLV